MVPGSSGHFEKGAGQHVASQRPGACFSASAAVVMGRNLVSIDKGSFSAFKPRAVVIPTAGD